MVRRAAAFVAIIALLVTACNRNSPTATKASPPPVPAPQPLVWSDCGDGFQCGWVQVPLDYAHPNAATINIAINRLPATDPTNRIGSLLFNFGGPGIPGVQVLHGAGSYFSNLNRRFDLVGFDPRGVGQSSPVRCLTAVQQDAANSSGDVVLDDPQEKQASIQGAKDYAAACLKRSGNILPFVDTQSAARDMDVIRAALGDTKLTYLGFSYGTMLGQAYAHLFPTHVRALSLDGVEDPNLSAIDFQLAQVVGFEQSLQAFLTDCRARKSTDSPCTYAQTSDPETKLLALDARLDKSPMAVGDRTLTRPMAQIAVLAELYDPSSWPNLDQMLTEADRGDGTKLLAVADDYNGRGADGQYNNGADAISAITCLDQPVPTDVAVYDALGAAYAKASAFFGPGQQYTGLGCVYWPVKATGHVGPLTADGAPPILLVGGTGDPATPFVWAQNVNRSLAGSVLLARNGNGHISYNKSACAQQAEDAYLINLTLPAVGTVCN